MILANHTPTLRALHLLSNHAEYALTLEEHVTEDGGCHLLVALHNESPLGLGAIATLVQRLFALRISFPDAPLYCIEPSPNDTEWEEFAALFGFEPFADLPCTDDKVRRLFRSEPLTGRSAA